MVKLLEVQDQSGLFDDEELPVQRPPSALSRLKEVQDAGDIFGDETSAPAPIRATTSIAEGEPTSPPRPVISRDMHKHMRQMKRIGDKWYARNDLGVVNEFGADGLPTRVVDDPAILSQLGQTKPTKVAQRAIDNQNAGLINTPEAPKKPTAVSPAAREGDQPKDFGTFMNSLLSSVGGQNLELSGHTLGAFSDLEDGDLKDADELIALGKQGQAAYKKAPVQSMKDIGSFSDAWQFAQQAAGQGLGSTVIPMVGGMAGGYMGSRVGGKVGATIGGTFGAFAGSNALNIGAMRQELIEQGVTDRKLRGKVSIMGGLAMSALDSLLPGEIAGKLTGGARREVQRTIINRILRNMGKAALKEGSTEGAQQVIQDVGGKVTAGKEIDIKKLAWDVADNIAAGAIGGAVLGGAGEGAPTRDDSLLDQSVAQERARRAAGTVPNRGAKANRQATPADEAVRLMRGAGYSPEDIRAMAPEQYAQILADLKAQGQRPAAEAPAEEPVKPPPGTAPLAPRKGQKSQKPISGLPEVDLPVVPGWPTQEVPTGTQPSQERTNSLYDQAEKLIRAGGKPSTSFIQRKLGLGYKDAAEIMFQLEKAGVVSPATGTGERQVLPPKDTTNIPENMPAGQEPAADIAKTPEIIDLPSGGKLVEAKHEDVFGDGSKAKPVTIDDAGDLAAVREKVTPEPSEAQIEAGNYEKAHVKLRNLPGRDISIETAAGGTRRSKAKDLPVKWSVQMQHDYGHFLGTKGADGQPIDVFIGPNPGSDRAFIIYQQDPIGGKFDEHKVIIGANNEQEARDIYTAGFSDGKGEKRIQSIEEMDMSSLNSWLDNPTMPSHAMGMAGEEKPMSISSTTNEVEKINTGEGEVKAEGEKPEQKQSAETEKPDLTAKKELPVERTKQFKRYDKWIDENAAILADKKGVREHIRMDERLDKEETKLLLDKWDAAEKPAEPVKSEPEPVSTSKEEPAPAKEVSFSDRTRKLLDEDEVAGSDILDLTKDRGIDALPDIKAIAEQETDWDRLGLLDEIVKRLRSNAKADSRPLQSGTSKKKLAAHEAAVKAFEAARAPFDEVGKIIDERQAAALKKVMEETGFKSGDYVEFTEETYGRDGEPMARPPRGEIHYREGDTSAQIHDEGGVLFLNPRDFREFLKKVPRPTKEEEQAEIDAAIAEIEAEKSSTEKPAETQAETEVAEEKPAEPEKVVQEPTQAEKIADILEEASKKVRETVERKKGDGERALYIKPGQLQPGDKIVDLTYGHITVEKVLPFDPKYPKSQQVETDRGRRDFDPEKILTVSRSQKPKTEMMQDAGEKIGGARKDLWKERGLRVSDLAGMTDAEKAAYTTKENVWPRPDYAQMVEDGTTAEAAYLVKILYDRIGTKPWREQDEDAIELYITAINTLRPLVEGIKTVDDAKKVDSAFKDAMLVAQGIDLNDRYGKPYKDYLYELGTRTGRRWRTRSLSLWLTGKDLQKAKRAADEGFPNQEPWQRVFTVVSKEKAPWHIKDKFAAGEEWVAYHKKNGNKRFFDRKEDAEAWAREQYEKIKGTAEEGPQEPKRPHLDSITRVGPDYRKGKDVSGDDLVKDFGFRGIEFGNWVASDERQKTVNLAYDALMDMARVLKLPPKAMSLNGTMGVAFGARGGGRFAAHYEPHKLVINMTKLSGAGSLAHEWGHALDHYLGEHLQGMSAYKGSASYLSGGHDVAKFPSGSSVKVTKRLASDVRNLMQTLYFGKETNEAMQKRLDKAVADARRNLKAWKDYVAGAVERAKKGPQGSWEKKELRRAKEAIPQWEDILERAVNARAHPTEAMRQKADSAYYQEAQKLSGQGDYWKRGTEMLARSFETWIFDELHAADMASDYLVHGVEETRYKEGYKGNPYPVGAERKAQAERWAAVRDALQAVEGTGEVTGKDLPVKTTETAWKNDPVDLPAPIDDETTSDELNEVNTASEPALEQAAEEAQIEKDKEKHDAYGNELRPAASEVSDGEQAADDGGPGEEPGAIETPQRGGRASNDDVRRDQRQDDEQSGPAHGSREEGGSAVPDTPGRRGNGARGSDLSTEIEQERDERRRRNYHISDEDRVGQGGAREKITANIEAIRTLKQLEVDRVEATDDQKRILVRYVGWGAFAQDVFADHKPEYAKERQALKDLLSPEEYRAARESTLNAHYTSPEVIKGIWRAMKHLGFTGGRALEPSAGVGHFIGFEPADLAGNTDWSAVELDPITGRILGKLYSGTDVTVAGFETFQRPKNFYDLAISNVPFGDYKLADKNYPALNIHDYFFVKALDLVRPGGIVSFITSSGTMDKERDRARQEINKRADFLGAIRLPGGRKGAFAGNAGTEVTTDIIFLRKRAPGEQASPLAKPWADLKEIKTPEGKAFINEYFADNPKMMLGEMRLLGTMYRRDQPVLIGTSEGIEEKIATAAENLPENSMLARSSRLPNLKEKGEPETTSADGGVKEGAFFIKDGKIFRKTLGVGVLANLSGADMDRLRPLIEIRDVVNELLRRQAEGAHGNDNLALRKELTRLYDKFVKKFGPINATNITVTTRKTQAGDNVTIRKMPNFSAFRSDPDAYKVAAIELYDEEKNVASKAAIFTADVIGTTVVPAVSGPADAIAVSLNETGRVDLPLISKLLGRKQIMGVSDELGDLVYLNPETDQWQTREHYLSGDVVKKLHDARTAAKTDRAYERNVKALEDVQPTPLTREDIGVPMGASWVPVEHVERFISDELDSSVALSLNPYSKQWGFKTDYFDQAAQTKYGTRRMNVTKIVLGALNSTPVRVTDKDRDGREVVDQEATKEAQVKVQMLRDAWKAWLWKDEARAQELENLYNANFNRLVPQKFDGSHLTLPGLASSIRTATGDIVPFSLRPHQKNAVWRIIQNGNTLLDHVVGAGKTFTMIAAGMEQKRLGLVQRPIYVVPNHMLEQFSREFLQAYPGANILIAQKDEMSRDNRRAFVAKVAAQSWDGIVITHDAFGRIPVSNQAYQDFYTEEVEAIADALAEAKQAAGEKDPSVKQLEKTKKRAEAKLKKLADEASKDQGVTFEEMGVDHIYLDEAHLFKNLAFYTRHTRVKGLGQGDAQRATDMFIKIKALDKRNPKRSAVFATGTPISNTMAEMYTMQRYLQLETLKEYDIDKFDAWASTFGEIVTKMELSPDGRTFRETTSFSRFTNIPELVAVYSLVADTQTADMLQLPRPKRKNGKITIVEAEPSPREEAIIAALVRRAEEVRGKRAEKGGDNMLRIVSEGRKVATDVRLLDPAEQINPVGKTRLLVENVFRRWKEGKDPGLAQMIFLDMGTPKPPPSQKSIQAAEYGKAWDDMTLSSREAWVRAAGSQLKEIPTELLDRPWRKLSPGNQAAISKVPPPANAETNMAEDEDGDAQYLAAKFNLYEDIREKLTDKGIPREQIAFIHEATDDAKKAVLFDKVRRGKVRVLIGSTGKMGVGTNVQTRLVAMHHMDAPWKPAEVEQRDGRIERQGNLNDEIEILRYITKRSFDSFMWQALERKANFIAQIRAGARGVRHAEDIDTPLPEAAELKAAASGDPRIMEHAELSKDVRDLEAQESTHNRTIYSARQALKDKQSQLEHAQKQLPMATADLGHVESMAGDAFHAALTIEPKGKVTKRAEMGEAIKTFLLDQAASMARNADAAFKLGTLSGFTMSAAVQVRQGAIEFRPILKGNLEYSPWDRSILTKDSDPVGIAQRFVNLLGAVAPKRADYESSIANAKEQIAKLTPQTENKPFPKQADLDEKRRRLKELTDDLTPKKPDPNAQRGTTAQPNREVTKTEAFKKWFGDSKVVDEKGEPLRAYHGTRQDFESFDTRHQSKNPRPNKAWSGDLGSWFTAESKHQGNYDPENAEFMASDYAGRDWKSDDLDAFKPGARVIPVYLSIKNPKEYDGWEDFAEDRILDNGERVPAEEFRAKLIAEGHDGIVIRNSMTDGNVDRDDWIAFEPTQIKSVFNRGTFDPTKPGILADRSNDGFWKGLVESQRLDQITREHIREVERMAEQILGHRLNVQVVSSLPTGNLGEYDARTRTIYVAVAAALSDNRTLHHEVIHAFRDAGILTPAEWGVLRRFAQENVLPSSFWQERRLDWAHYEGQALSRAALDELMIEEAVAEAFVSFMNGEANFTSNSLVERIYGKLRMFLERVRAFFTGAGFRTVEDIFGDIAEGRMRDRPMLPEGRTGRSWGWDPILTVPTAEATTAQPGVTAQPPLYRRMPPTRPPYSTFVEPDDNAMSVLTNRTLPMLARVTGSIGSMFAPLRKGMQDRMIHWKRVQEAIEQQIGPVDPASDVYRTETLMAGRTGERIEDFRIDDLNPLLERMASDKVTSEELGQYLYANHAEERNRVVGAINPPGTDFNDAVTDPSIVGASGMSTDEANAILANARPEVIQAAQEVYRILRETRDRLLREGIIDQATYNHWTQTYKHYVPLRGFEADPEEGARLATGSRYDSRARVDMQALGRRSKADNPFAYVIAGAQQSIILSEKARVGRAVLAMARRYPNSNLWEVNQVVTRRYLNKSTGLVQSMPDNNKRRLADNVLAVRVGGNLYWVTIHHQGLAAGVRGMDAPSINAVFRHMINFNRFLAMTRTSWNPNFFIPNFLKDAETAGIHLTGEQGARVALKVARDIPAAMRGVWQGQLGHLTSQWAQYHREFAQAGGKVGTWGLIDIEDIKKRVNGELRKLQPGVANRMIVAKDWALEMMSNVNGAIENAVRLSTYVNLRREGFSQDEAAFVAKELTVNFNRKGEWGTIINSLYLFANAGIQGSARMAIALARSKVVRRIALGLFVYGVLLDFMNAALSGAGDDDDDKSAYDALPEYLRERNMVFMWPGANQPIKIPLPWGYNTFHYAGVNFGRYLRGKIKGMEASTNIGAALLQAFNPVQSATWLQTVMPTIFDPATDLYMNTDWKGDPIMPKERDYGVPTPQSQRYFSTVSPLYKGVAETLNSLTGGDEVRPGIIDVSPEALEYVSDFLFGGVKMTADQMATTIEKVVTGEPIEWTKVPLVRTVYGGATPQTGRDEYYDMRDAVALTKAQFKRAVAEKDADKIKEIQAEYPADLKAAPLFDEFDKTLKQLNKALKAAPDSETKRRIRKKMDEIQAKARKTYDGLQKELGQ